MEKHMFHVLAFLFQYIFQRKSSDLYSATAKECTNIKGKTSSLVLCLGKHGSLKALQGWAGQCCGIATPIILTCHDLVWIT